MNDELTVEKIRQELRNAIFHCGFYAIAFRIEGRDDEYKQAILNGQNFAAFGVNVKLFTMDEGNDWLDGLYERNDKTVGQITLKYDADENSLEGVGG